MDYIIVIDMQNDFIDGALLNKDAQTIINPLAEYIKNTTAKVIFTQDTHEKNYLDTQEGKKLPIKHCIKDTKGWEITDKLKDLVPASITFEKNTFGSIRLCEYLLKQKDINRIILTGVCTDICVISNAFLLKAYMPEAEICVYEKYCAGTSKENHNNAINAMRACQIDII